MINSPRIPFRRQDNNVCITCFDSSIKIMVNIDKWEVKISVILNVNVWKTSRKLNGNLAQSETQTSISNRSISTTWQYSISPSVFASQNISSSSISVISHSLYEHSDELPSLSPFTQTALRFKDSIPSSSSSILLLVSLVAVVRVRFVLPLLLLPLTIVLVDIEYNVDCDLSIVTGGRKNRIVYFSIVHKFLSLAIFFSWNHKFVTWNDTRTKKNTWTNAPSSIKHE